MPPVYLLKPTQHNLTLFQTVIPLTWEEMPPERSVVGVKCL